MSPKGIPRTRSTSISRAPSVSSSEASLSCGFAGWRWLEQEGKAGASQASTRSRSASLARSSGVQESRSPNDQPCSHSRPTRSRSPAGPRSTHERRTLVISCCTKSEQWPALQCVAATGQLPLLDVNLAVQPSRARTAEEWTLAVLEEPGSEKLAQRAMAQLYPQSDRGPGNIVVLVTDSSPEAAASLAEVVASWQQCLIGPARAFQFDAPMVARPAQAMAELRDWLGPLTANSTQPNFPAQSKDPPCLLLPLSKRAATAHRRMWRHVRKHVARRLGIHEPKGPRRIAPPPWLRPDYQARMDAEAKECTADWLRRSQACIYTRPANHMGPLELFEQCGTAATVQQRFWDIAHWIPWGHVRDRARTTMTQEAVYRHEQGWPPGALDAWLTASIRQAIFEDSPCFSRGQAKGLPASFYDDAWTPYALHPPTGAPWTLQAPMSHLAARPSV